MKPAPDHKSKRLSRQEQFEKQMVAYFDEKLLNVVTQVRAICIAAKIKPEDFWSAFVDDEKQDSFYVSLHVAQDSWNMEQKLKKAEESEPELPELLTEE